jgi:pSer/pThr/pTyr-binding forkhead associated (FHA) protein
MERIPVHVYDVNSFAINVGRAEDMQIMIDSTSVSRRQAQIRMEDDGSWTVRDLGSTNGTFLNGQRLATARPLNRGDEISFGKFSLFFDSRIAEPVAEAIPSKENDDPARQLTDTFYLSTEDAERLRRAVILKRRAQLRWEAKGKSGTFYLENAAALVGRSTLCDLCVPAGPRQHVLVMRSKFGVEVRNLSAWYRMTVNGWGFSQSVLRTGDVIEIGGLRLTFLDALG